MKTNKILLGAAAFAVAGLSACSSSELVENIDQKVDTDQTRFMAIELSAPKADLTRAFEDGTAAESEVTRLDFFFYDQLGNITGTPVTVEGENLDENDFTSGPFESGNVTKIWTSVVPVQLSQGDNLPSYVMCLVNANEEDVKKVTGQPMGELRSLEMESSFNKTTGNFIMANSVYYGTNELTGELNQRMSATPINPNNQLFTTSNEAKNAITSANGTNATDEQKAALLNIYVERVSAKIGLNLDKANIENVVLANGSGEGNVTLQFNALYWFMNATDRSTFITKRYGIENADGSINYYPDYDVINNAFNATGMKDIWNAPEYHRSYWGCSPAYYDSEYPLVSDQINDLASGSTTNEYPVNYYTYNQVVNQAKISGNTRQALASTDGSFATTTNGGGYIYSRETTTVTSDIQNTLGNPAATVASAVIVGKYSIIDGDQTTPIAAGSRFFVDPNNKTEETQGTFYKNSQEAENALIARQHVLFINQGTAEDPDLVPYTDPDAYNVQHPTASVRNLLPNPNISGRLSALQLTHVPEETNIVYYDGQDYVQVTAANLNIVNVQLIQTGYLNTYYEGLAFYNIPIRHLGFDIDNVNDALYKDGEYNWNKMKLGDLGLVRNHVYNMTVSKIEGMGTGLRNPDQPIVPEKDEVNQYIAMRLNILAWNVVNSWSVSF